MLTLMIRIFAPLAPIATVIAVLAPLAALANAPVALGPDKGKFGDWTAATYGTGSSKICYAFTTPQTSSPTLPKRGMAMLTVTERHGSHDEVSITPGFTYPKSASVNLTVGDATIPFYVQENVAFTDRVSKALDGFTRQNDATTVSSGPDGKKLTDKFSLAGFSDAYKAIVKACP